jgi:GNAT superfamily N-acetyltransferase
MISSYSEWYTSGENGMKYQIHNRLPTLAEYHHLCESVGWGQIMNFDVAASALENSVTGFTVCLDNGDVIAMGRIVGDGAIYFYIQDVVVAPDYQGRGVGTAIIASLFAYLRENAPPKSFVGLFATPHAVEFYKKFTLEQRDLVGLFTVKELIVSQ